MCEYVEFLMYLDELKAISSNDENLMTMPLAEIDYQEQETIPSTYKQ